MHTITYSILLPIRNERESVPQLFAELKTAMQGKAYELIAIDDASTDGSYQAIKPYTIKLPVKIIRFSTHRGKWAALRVGITQARGTYVITMDTDLQDDPRQISKLVPKIHQGFDVVSGWRKNRQDPLYKVVLTCCANSCISFLTGYRFHDFSSSMKLYTKKSLAIIPKEGSFLRYAFLLAQQNGLRITEVPIVHRKRMYGQSKFGILKYFRIIYDLLLLSLLFRGSGRLK